MSNCCATHAIADQFGRDLAREELERYRESGPLPTTQALIGAIKTQGVNDADLLDIGAGVGALHHALLEMGARRAVHVDISPEYIAVAREETARRGHAQRVEFVTGDFVAMASGIGAADVVTLDRVICCYPDMEQLVARSAEKARRVYGAVYPRDNWWTRLGVWGMNVMKFLRRSGFRSYVHAPAAIDALLRRSGLERCTVQRTFFWEVAVYMRAAGT